MKQDSNENFTIINSTQIGKISVCVCEIEWIWMTIMNIVYTFYWKRGSKHCVIWVRSAYPKNSFNCIRFGVWWIFMYSGFWWIYAHIEGTEVQSWETGNYKWKLLLSLAFWFFTYKLHQLTIYSFCCCCCCLMNV